MCISIVITGRRPFGWCKTSALSLPAVVLKYTLHKTILVVIMICEIFNGMWSFNVRVANDTKEEATMAK